MPGNYFLSLGKREVPELPERVTRNAAKPFGRLRKLADRTANSASRIL